MKIKLEITSGELTPKQKGAIVEKLEEIRAIVKGESSKPQSRGEKIGECFTYLNSLMFVLSSSESSAGALQ